jgi:diguanylate cyclase (GGDEF)-like protein
MRAPLPSNERDRISALTELRIDETGADDRLDEIVGLAAELCGVPMAAISLVDQDHQWFKASRGLELAGLPREHSLCAHAILGEHVMVIDDASADDRFADTELVAGPSQVRFYAAAPLMSAEGHAIGTLCVMDTEPRELPRWQLTTLEVLARQAMAHLRLSRLVDDHAGALDDLDMAERNLSFLSTHDALTGLLNRRSVCEIIEGLTTANASGAISSALLFIDLDNFKDINDAFGHEAGDRVLVTIADRLHLGARGDDAVARLASDEFVVLIPHAASLAPESLARRLLQSVSIPVEWNGLPLMVTASIGIVRWSDDMLSANDLLRAGDAAMHYAKIEGRNRYVTFEDRVADEVSRRLDSHSFVRNVVTSGSLRLDFQPLWSLSNGTLIAHEALLRWDSPDGAPEVGPAEFVKAAEEIGLVGEITEFTIREACRLAARRRDAGEPQAAVTINLSAVQLERDEVILLVASALNDSGLDPSGLILELTESAKLAESGPGQATLRELQNMGVRIALDDFGTGFASLALLRNFPFDFMKIDGSFVNVQTEMDREVLRSIVQLGHSLGMMVVAEGIEEPNVLEQLRELGCDMAQGYLLGRPGAAVPTDHLADQLVTHPLITGVSPH